MKLCMLNIKGNVLGGLTQLYTLAKHFFQT